MGEESTVGCRFQFSLMSSLVIVLFLLPRRVLLENIYDCPAVELLVYIRMHLPHYLWLAIKLTQQTLDKTRRISASASSVRKRNSYDGSHTPTQYRDSWPLLPSWNLMYPLPNSFASSYVGAFQPLTFPKIPSTYMFAD